MLFVVKRLFEFSFIFWLVEYVVKKLFSFGVFLFNSDKVDSGGYLEDACAKLLFKLLDSFDFLVFAFEIVDAKIDSFFLIILLFVEFEVPDKSDIDVDFVLFPFWLFVSDFFLIKPLIAINKKK